MSWLSSIKRLLGGSSSRDELLEDGLLEPDFTEERKSTFKDISEPRASFTVVGFEEGRIKVEFDWNDAFIKTINALGFVAETEEDTVQLFFYASSMRPTELSEEIQDLSAPEVQLTRDTVRVVQ